MAKAGFDSELFADVAAQQSAASNWDAGKKIQPKNQPQGTFQAEITAAELGRSASSDRLQIHYEMVILLGPSKDTIIHKYDGLETPEQVNMTQRQLTRLGADISKMNLEELPAVLLELEHQKVVIRCKQNKEFYNIFFQKVVGAQIGDRSSDSPTPPARRTSKRF
jgi:hypothetical protein